MATPLVAISDGVQIWVALGCSKGSIFFLTILTPALALGESITRCTLAIHIGWAPTCSPRPTRSPFQRLRRVLPGPGHLPAVPGLDRLPGPLPAGQAAQDEAAGAEGHLRGAQSKQEGKEEEEVEEEEQRQRQQQQQHQRRGEGGAGAAGGVDPGPV